MNYLDSNRKCAKKDLN